MPYMTNGQRDYKKEYEKYAGRPSEIHKRVLRNKARRALAAKGLVHKGDGKDVDHIKPLSEGGSGRLSNTRVRSAHANRSYHRTRTGAIA
jgi:hypothetical protein